MTIQTRDQHFAKAVYKQVAELTDSQDFKVKKYCAIASKLPILIRSSGLMQAYAFVESRAAKEKEVEAKKFLEHFAETLSFGSQSALGDKVRTSDLVTYMHLTRNALAALLWYKRFAQSVHKYEPGSEESE